MAYGIRVIRQYKALRHYHAPPPFRRPGCALNSPTWSPVKGRSARVSPNRLSYGCPTTIFRDPHNRLRHHLSATLLDGRAGNGWAGCYDALAIARPAGFRMLVISRIRHAAIVP